MRFLCSADRLFLDSGEPEKDSKGLRQLCVWLSGYDALLFQFCLTVGTYAVHLVAASRRFWQSPVFAQRYYAVLEKVLRWDHRERLGASAAAELLESHGRAPCVIAVWIHWSVVPPTYMFELCHIPQNLSRVNKSVYVEGTIRSFKRRKFGNEEIVTQWLCLAFAGG